MKNVIAKADFNLELCLPNTATLIKHTLIIERKNVLKKAMENLVFKANEDMNEILYGTKEEVKEENKEAKLSTPILEDYIAMLKQPEVTPRIIEDNFGCDCEVHKAIYQVFMNTHTDDDIRVLVYNRDRFIFSLKSLRDTGEITPEEYGIILQRCLENAAKVTNELKAKLNII